MRLVTQTQRDRQRVSYELLFPSDIDHDQAVSWIRAILASLGRGHTVAFELHMQEGAISYRLRVPWQIADEVEAQLYSLIPGAAFQELKGVDLPNFTYVVEAGLTDSPQRPEMGGADTSNTTLLAPTRDVADDEALMVQMVVAPGGKQPTAADPPFKLSLMGLRMTPNKGDSKPAPQSVRTVIRVATMADTDARARKIADSIKHVMDAVLPDGVKLTKMRWPQSQLRKRAVAATAPLDWPGRLTINELAGLTAWPFGSPFVPGLPAAPSLRLPTDRGVATEGIVLGDSNVSGHKRPVALSFDDALVHFLATGRSRVGKSSLLASMARQMMDEGHGIILIEPEGDLYGMVLDQVPEFRRDDVICFDVTDRDFPVGFNPLDQGNPATVADELMSLLTHRFGKHGMGVWAKEYLHHGLQTIGATPGLSFIDVVPLLSPQAHEVDWAREVSNSVKDYELNRWWQRHESKDIMDQQRRSDPVLSRIWELTSRPELRYVLGQSESSFKMRDVIEQNKILLVNLKGVPPEAQSLAGTLIMNSLWLAAKAYGRESSPNFLFLDEFAEFMDLPIKTDDMLSQARKHGLGMMLATQFYSQLKVEVQDAVMTNAATKLAFRSSAKDGQLLAREMSRMIKPEDLTNLQKYEAIAQVVTPTGTSRPLTLRTRKPEPPRGGRDTLRADSRAKYGRPIAQVRAEMEARHSVKPKTTQPQNRPPISGE